MWVRGMGRKTQRRGRRKRRKSSSYLEGFQQAHTVTKVIRRNMPPVDRMMYSELLPKPEWFGGRWENKERKKDVCISNSRAIQFSSHRTTDFYLCCTDKLQSFFGLQTYCMQNYCHPFSVFIFDSGNNMFAKSSVFKAKHLLFWNFFFLKLQYKPLMKREKVQWSSTSRLFATVLHMQGK